MSSIYSMKHEHENLELELVRILLHQLEIITTNFRNSPKDIVNRFNQN